MVLQYLVKMQSEQTIGGAVKSTASEEGFIGVNLYYLLGTMAEMLSLNYLGPQAIYSMHEEQTPISYNLQIFEFLAHSSLR